MTEQDQRKILLIASLAVARGVTPNQVAESQGDDFGRHFSLEIFDAMADIRNGRKPMHPAATAPELQGKQRTIVTVQIDDVEDEDEPDNGDDEDDEDCDQGTENDDTDDDREDDDDEPAATNLRGFGRGTAIDFDLDDED